MSLKGKTVYITGASGGIGSALARRFHAAGCRVALFWHNDGSAVKLASELGEGAAAFRCDVADCASVCAAFSEAEAALGNADILVNNAGVALFGLLQDCSDADFDRVAGVNLKGVFNCCKRALPAMIAAKSGAIVNVSSMWGVSGASCEAVYSATKAGVIGLTKALAKEVAPSGVTVNCVAPGVIDTPMNAHLSPETKAELAAETPLGRIGTPEEVADAIAFLADSSFITGQTLSVDGGFLL
ncbi:MAG: SDR family oxidoreductase [Clostridia bacterium]|nr:SDR family oxidoreductase [Clostridia bacterium]